MQAAALQVGAADGAVAVLREATPFGDASEALLQRIAAIARPDRYSAGARIYSADDAADDIFVVVSGRAEQTPPPHVEGYGDTSRVSPPPGHGPQTAARHAVIAPRRGRI